MLGYGKIIEEPLGQNPNVTLASNPLDRCAPLGYSPMGGRSNDCLRCTLKLLSVGQLWNTGEGVARQTGTSGFSFSAPESLPDRSLAASLCSRGSTPKAREQLGGTKRKPLSRPEFLGEGENPTISVTDTVDIPEH